LDHELGIYFVSLNANSLRKANNRAADACLKKSSVQQVPAPSSIEVLLCLCWSIQKRCLDSNDGTQPDKHAYLRYAPCARRFAHLSLMSICLQIPPTWSALLWFILKASINIKTLKQTCVDSHISPLCNYFCALVAHVVIPCFGYIILLVTRTCSRSKAGGVLDPVRMDRQRNKRNRMLTHASHKLAWNSSCWQLNIQYPDRWKWKLILEVWSATSRLGRTMTTMKPTTLKDFTNIRFVCKLLMLQTEGILHKWMHTSGYLESPAHTSMMGNCMVGLILKHFVGSGSCAVNRARILCHILASLQPCWLDLWAWFVIFARIESSVSACLKNALKCSQYDGHFRQSQDEARPAKDFNHKTPRGIQINLSSAKCQ